jgi:endonuclease YncB( thermonuclease family)
MSKDFLVKELSKGDVVIKTKKDKKGKFGRILGELYVNDININQMMIHGFYAVSYDGQSKEEIEEEHIRNRQTLIAKGWFDPDSI